MKRDGSDGQPRDLGRYNEMRDFGITDEPSGKVARTETGRSFVVQKHDATRLHYDFRLELDGVLLSWAVPKGPSLVPGEKRLAVQTEDHPIDYRDFEGSIPDGQYGGGPVIVWDRGTWTPVEDPRKGLEKGHLAFSLDGEKIKGRFDLVRTKGFGKKPSWLLIKRTDEHARREEKASIVEERPESVLTGRTIADVLAGVPARAPATAKTAKTAKKSAIKAVVEKTTTKTTTKTTRKKKAAATAEKKAPRGKPLPEFGSIAPQLATLVKDVPTSGPWIYEIKYDGYRTMAWLDDGKVKLASRRGHDWTKTYAAIARALARVRAKNAIFDGEVAYVLDDGRTSFQKLQNTLGGSSAEDHGRLVYFVFDLLHYDGVDLTDEPLAVRKEKLRTILAGESPPLRMSDDLLDGANFFKEACRLDLEGIIGKRMDRPYHGGRNADWIKIKCQKRQELVIVGYTPPKGSRTGIGALLLGVQEGKSLRYAGKVGTGFSHATLNDLAKKLGKLHVDVPPVTNAPNMRVAKWVKPELVGEIRFSEWTSDGVLRHASFEGLRLDKAPSEVKVEVEKPTPKVSSPASKVSSAAPKASAHAAVKDAKDAARPRVDGVVISHPERVMDVESGLTKLDLARYAGEMAETMLPYVAKRPLMLLRCPGGTQTSVFRQSDRRQGKKSSCFVQKHSGQGLNAANLGSKVISGEEALFVTSAKQIVTLAQNNTVEMHGWGATFPKWDRPDWMVLDLDPDESLPFSRVVESAFETRDALKTLGLESWVKTTGGKGLHVVVPIARRYDWETVRRVSQQIAVLLAHAAPDRYVANMSLKQRVGKIFVDYLRNAEGATAVLPYSARARNGLTVAVPMEWKDIRAVNPQELTITTVPALVARRKADPWADLLEARQILPRELLDAGR